MGALLGALSIAGLAMTLSSGARAGSMKKIPTGIACALLLCATGVTAQVPRVLGIWEFDPQASGLPKGSLLASETRSYDLRDDGYVVNVVIRKVTNGQTRNT